MIRRNDRSTRRSVSNLRDRVARGLGQHWCSTKPFVATVLGQEEVNRLRTHATQSAQPAIGK